MKLTGKPSELTWDLFPSINQITLILQTPCFKFILVKEIVPTFIQHFSVFSLTLAMFRKDTFHANT